MIDGVKIVIHLTPCIFTDILFSNSIFEANKEKQNSQQNHKGTKIDFLIVENYSKTR